MSDAGSQTVRAARKKKRKLYSGFIGAFEYFLASKDIKRRLRNREFHEINTGRPGVFIGDDGLYKLEYYKSDDQSTKTTVNLSDIATISSKNDNITKYSFLFISIIIFILIGLTPHANEIALSIGYIDKSGEINKNLYIAYSGLIFILIFSFGVGYIRGLELKFVKTNKDWEVAVSNFLQEPPEKKFQGIKECLLAFRRFIKWRRSSNFIMFILVPIYFVVISISIYHAEKFELIHALLMLVNSLAMAVVLICFRVFVGLHTSYRDPTVQLCVMVAELHARFVHRTFIGSSSR